MSVEVLVLIAVTIGCCGILGCALTDRLRDPTSSYNLRRAKIWPIGELPENTIGRLIGTVRPLGSTLSAPLTGRECVSWLVTVDAGSDTQGYVIIREQRAVRFALEDASGRAIIEPEGADLEGPSGRSLIGWDHAELQRKNAYERESGWRSTWGRRCSERERAFLAERADSFNKSWRSHLLSDRPGLSFREEIVEIGEIICVAGAGIRESDPDAEPDEGYRTAPPTRLRFSSSPKLRILITDAPSRS